MKYILIITAAFLFGCGNKEADQQAQTQQVLKNNREATEAIIPLIKERDKKINALIAQGKQKEALEVSDNFKRQVDSVMRINR